MSHNTVENHSCCVVIQSCDKYKEAWNNLFWSMKKYWDQDIPCTIYFCNETIDLDLTGRYKQIKTGKMSHIEMMRKIIKKELCDYEYIFYMLEDFWPTDRMTKNMFLSLFEIMKKNNWDSLRVASHMPAYYELEKTNYFFENEMIFKYKRNSPWMFSQQAAFWKRSFLEKCLDIETESSPEQIVSSSLPIEIAIDKNLRDKFPDAEIYHYHYMWYPIAGSYWRGEITLIGKQIDFARQVQDLIEEISK